MPPLEMLEHMTRIARHAWMALVGINSRPLSRFRERNGRFVNDEAALVADWPPRPGGQ